MMKHLLIILLMLFFLTIIATAQETEDVVYLKNGSVIRGTITELTPNINLKIQTRDGRQFVFQMNEVEKVAKEPVSAQTSSTSEKKTETTSLDTANSAFGGLLLGAHSGLGMNLPFVGVMGFYDTEINLNILSGSGNSRERIGIIGNLEYSFAKSGIPEVLDADTNFLLASALVCLGSQPTKNSTLRIGGGIAFTSVDTEVFNYSGSRSEITPTAIAAWTFYPRTDNRKSFALTFSVRWQGQGVMFAITPGILQRGIGR